MHPVPQRAARGAAHCLGGVDGSLTQTVVLLQCVVLQVVWPMSDGQTSAVYPDLSTSTHLRSQGHGMVGHGFSAPPADPVGPCPARCPTHCLCQVFASGTGNPRPPLFFLDWARKITSSQEAVTVRRTQRRSSDLKLPTIKTAIKPPPAAAKPNRTAAAAGSFVSALGAVKGSPLPVVSASPAVDQEPPDVAAERMRVQRLPDCANHPIVLQQLHKTYPSRDGQQPKVRGSSRLLA